ncbi:hypothetical protein ES708_34437 [subsurface metagenome]
MMTQHLKKIKSGEIWEVRLSISSADTVGHEQSKDRPCIVIVNNPHISMTTLIPLTSKLKTQHYPDTCLIKKGKDNKLKHDSVALIFHLRSLSYKRFLHYIGKINVNDLKTIKSLIKNYFEL